MPLVATHERRVIHVGPTGRTMQFTSTAILRVEGGMIAETWDQIDTLGLLQQPGAGPE